MTRFGPLQSAPPALFIGDPTRLHLSVEAEGVRHLSGDTTAGVFGWVELDEIVLDLPQTTFRYPGAVAGLAMSLIAIATHDTPEFAARHGTAIMVRDGVQTTTRIDLHHLGGYWRGTIRATQLLLDKLVADPDSRALLENPDALVRTVAASKRWIR